MSLAMKARQKVKRKGASKDRVFGCDLVEHLQLSGQDVPQVLKSCTEFVEHHGIVDGIYRLSGVSSNIQKLRLEFDTERSPDLNKEVYLQDIHCVSSLCKAYFRELPNPLLTYQLYDKFADAVAIQLEEGRLVKIKEVLKELPQPHYRTLEFLMKHLVHMASYSSKTNMHVRNLAIVWAPNLLRSKDIETSGFNGTAAFMEVRIQSIVVEFILTHVEQLFGDAPLTGSRESIRKSLLLMESPMALADEKYCFSYNVPAMLNQGDGPPQMRPYHTIIELTDSKKKGSLKAKKWRSIFNLGRASNDAKRKSGKMEDKDDKATKLRLRPAKSMDSLSSMPSTSDDDAQLGRKKSQKQLTRCRESFDGPASLDSSFLETDEYPEKVKGEERQGESEGEATAKSEPTTPKVSRSSLVGVAPHGRSPKTGRSRAEKCAGVHISGPFSVTVPFHITSNLTLSRLTRGLECPALNHCGLENEAPESSLAKEEETSKEKDEEPKLMPMATTKKDTPTEANIEILPDSEENRISMEVQDSFSFLESQDAWLGDTLDGDYPRKSSHTAFDCRDSEADGFLVPEDDMGSGFMNEMIGGGMQLDMFSAVPPMDYLSIEECMNEHSEEEDDQYYLATGCFDCEEFSKEIDSEEVYVSAFDDLSPLAAELEHLQEFTDRVPGALPPEGKVEDQPFSLIGEISPGDPTGSHQLEAGLEAQPGVFSAHNQDLANSSLNPELTSLSEEEEGVPLSSRSNVHGLEAVVKDKAKPVKEEPNLCLLQGKGADARGKDDLLLQLEQLLQDGCSGAVLEKTHGSPAPGYNKQTTQPSLEDDERQLHQTPPEVEQVHWPSCDPSIVADDSTTEMVWTFDEHVDCGFPSQEAELLQSGEIIYQLPTTEASLSTGDPTLPGAGIDVSSLLGNGSETTSSKSPPMPASLLALSPVQDASPGAALPCVPLPNGCSNSDALLLTASSPNRCPESPPRKPQQAPPAEALAVPKQVLSDGSVRMKLTANTTRIQQVKSFPVVPPKPQFAKIPPFLTPKTPTEEVPLTWPNPPTLDQDRGNGMKDESNEGSVPKPPRPLSLDTYCSNRGEDMSAEILMASSEVSTSPNPCCSCSDDLQKQRNSMPVSLEKYSRDCDGRGDAVPKLQCSPLDKYSPCFKSSNVYADGLQKRKGSLPESSEKDGGSSSAKSDDGRGESPQKQLPLGPGLLAKHSSDGSGVAPQKQRQTAWRNGSSMSFDEAVALAKERHMTQAPVRRMQTYCCGDVEGPQSPLRTEKPPPHPKPALKPLGQHPLRPLSCLGTAAPPEALVPGKLFFSQASPDITLEGQLSPTREALTFPQDLSPMRRLSLPKIGRRLSLSEEAPSMMPQERRIPQRDHPESNPVNSPAAEEKCSQ